MGTCLGALNPGDTFLLPWGREGTVIRKVGQDVEVILDGKRIGQEAVMSGRRHVLPLSQRSIEPETIH